MRTRHWVRPAWVACVAWLCWTVGNTSAYAQRPANIPLPEDCNATAGETKLSLDSRKRDIESRLTRLRDQIAKVSPGDRQPLEADLRKAQEDLLEIVFAADCLRLRPAAPKLPPPPLVERKSPSLSSRGPGASGPAPMAASPPPPPPPQASADRAAPRSLSVEKSAGQDAVEVVTYFATNRKRGADNAPPAETFANEPGGPLTFGRVVVSIPRTHTPGTVEQPQLWKFERTPDPNKHFILKSVTPLATDATRTEMSERLQSANEKSLLVFVHGYNNGFQDAALRTAQLAYDLQFPGVPFFYSWPSANRVRSYLQDEEAARLSESVFESVVRELSALPVQSIYIVAHSMGNRVVGHGLQRYVSAGGKTDRIKELMLAAPDINAEIFKNEIVPGLSQMTSTRTTIYASSSDVALIASKVVHGFRRVGESSGGVLVFKGLDTVDASNASPSMRNLGHSYLVDSTSVIKDLHAIIGSKLAAKARGLLPQGQEPEVYWQLPQ